MIEDRNVSGFGVAKLGPKALRSAAAIAGVACFLSTLCAGCYVETEPAAPVAQGEVVVSDPPPPPVAEAPPAVAPPNTVWVAGYHRWDGHQYQWQAGHYERPPRPAAHYQAGHWEARGRGKAWVEGRWI
jgi:hypothetical protein